MNKIAIAVFGILVVFCQIASANESQLKSEIEKHIAGLNQESLPKATASFHSLSPQYAPFTQMLQRNFQRYDISIELERFDYVGISGDYAVAKVISRAYRKGGAPFMDNQSTTFYFFKKDAGSWKIWAFMGVDSQPLR
jgi:hypothetical protein